MTSPLADWAGAPWPIVVFLGGTIAYFFFAALFERFLGRDVVLRFRVLAEGMAADAKTAEDRAIVRYYLDQSGETRFAAFFVALLPVIAVGAAAMGILEGDDESVEDRLYESEVESVRVIVGIDPSTCALWSDPRRQQLSDLSKLVAATASPWAILIALSYGWAVVPLLAFMAAIGLAKRGFGLLFNRLHRVVAAGIARLKHA
jgi:hypothetical protein